MDDFYYVANWWKYQHYRFRTPSWIKLHRSFFSDPAICSLSEVNQLNLIKLWFVASEMEGRFPRDSSYIKSRLSLYHARSSVDLLALLESKGLISKEDTRGHRRQSSITEKETEKSNKEQKLNASEQKTAPPPEYAFEDSNLKITKSQSKKFQDAFPWVDLPAEYAKMAAWLEANPDKRPKLHGRFAHNWLSKVHHNGGSSVSKADERTRRNYENFKAAAERIRRREEAENLNRAG